MYSTVSREEEFALDKQILMQGTNSKKQGITVVLFKGTHRQPLVTRALIDKCCTADDNDGNF